MTIYLDSSALVKRYVDEPGSESIREGMSRASHWLASRITYVESIRAVLGGARDPEAAMGRLQNEWPRFDVVDLDQELAEHASEISALDQLRTLDAIQLASALRIRAQDLVIATWDRRLWRAAKRKGLDLLPETLPRSY